MHWASPYAAAMSLFHPVGVMPTRVSACSMVLNGCRSLGLTIDAKTTLGALSAELDATWHAVAARLPDNPAIQLSENTEGKTEVSLGALEKLEEPNSLLQLRAAVADLMPRVDLPEILLEIAARTGFAEAFTHVSERNARADNLVTSLCAVRLGGACNTGLEPFIRNDNQALRRDRLFWVSQNYLRADTLSAANAILVAAQSQLELAQVWGGGEVASAQEDQLGALGLVVNIIVLWNTLYMTATVERLKQHGYPVLDEDLARLSPLIFEHINMLGRYSFAVPEEVARGELRPLRNPDDDI